MNLKADVAFGVGFVDFLIGEIGDEGAVDPSFDIRSLGDDAEVVPLAVFEVLVRDELFFWGEPASAGGFAVDVTCFGSFGAAGFAFHLGAEEASAEFAFLGVAEMGADLATGVEFVVDLGVELDFEVSVLLVGDEEGIWATFCGGADDDAVFDLVGCVPALDGPIAEVFAVEGMCPFVCETGERDGGKESGDE